MILTKTEGTGPSGGPSISGMIDADKKLGG